MPWAQTENRKKNNKKKLQTKTTKGIYLIALSLIAFWFLHQGKKKACPPLAHHV
jgi:hypothetical protein